MTKLFSTLKIDHRYLYVYTLLLIGSIIALNITDISQDFVVRTSAMSYFLSLGILLLCIKGINITFAHFAHALKTNSPATFLVHTILLCIQIFLAQNSLVPLTRTPQSQDTFLLIFFAAAVFCVQAFLTRSRALIGTTLVSVLLYGMIFFLIAAQINIRELVLFDVYGFGVLILELILAYQSYSLIFKEFEADTTSK